MLTNDDIKKLLNLIKESGQFEPSTYGCGHIIISIDDLEDILMNWGQNK